MNLSVEDNGHGGIGGRFVVLQGVSASGNSTYAVVGRKAVTVISSNLSFNDGWGVEGIEGSAKITDSVIEGNEYGVFAARKVTLVGSSVDGNGEYGVRAGKAKIEDSSVAGNGTYAECLDEPEECADIQVGRLRVRNVGCDTSIRFDLLTETFGETWGVCADD